MPCLVELAARCLVKLGTLSLGPAASSTCPRIWWQELTPRARKIQGQFPPCLLWLCDPGQVD